MIQNTIKRFLVITLIISTTSLYAEEKLAQTGLQFLSVPPDARTASMAGATTTLSGNSSAMWSNPATMAVLENRTDIAFSLNSWIADIKHSAVSISYTPASGLYGTFGFSLLMVDYGAVEGTIFAQNEQGFLDIGDFNPNAYTAGLGYAKQLSNRFSVGGQVKLVHQYLGPAVTGLSAQDDKVKIDESELSTIAYDFGTIYRTGLKSFVFGMSVRNFSQEIKYVDESFQLPLTFSIGASVDLFDFIPNTENQNLFLSTDAIHPRSHLEQVKIALEYSYEKLISARMGYVSQADEQSFSYGFGVQLLGLGLDYAYTPFGLFNNVQQFTLRFSL